MKKLLGLLFLGLLSVSFSSFAWWKYRENRLCERLKPCCETTVVLEDCCDREIITEETCC